MSTEDESTSWLTEHRVRSMIEQTLTRADLRGLDVDEIEIEKSVLAQLPRLRAAARLELAAHRDALSAAGKDDLALLGLEQRLRWVWLAVNAFFGVLLILLLQSAIEVDWPWTHIRWALFPTVASSPTALLLGAATVIAAVVANLVLRAMGRANARRYRYSPAHRDVNNTEANLARRAQTETEALVREAVNALDGPGSTTGTVLTRPEAPALVELDSADTVPATGLRQVEEFIDLHPTSAIGVAGPRGVGKSTVLRRVSTNSIDDGHSKRRVGVYVQSPVYYQAADFVRTVHEEIARAVLRDARVHYADPELLVRRRSRNVRRLVVMGLFLLGYGLLALELLDATLPPVSVSGFLGVTLVGTAVCYLLIDMARSRADRRAAKLPEDQADLAHREIRKLTWSANVSEKDKLTLKLLPGIHTDSEQQTGYAERDRSHPDRVADLRNFLDRFNQISEIPIVVAIDELDKMASPEQAVEAINGLKDLFHLPNTHFVVSVSEDALASFALRGVPVRDVFDSSFDDVIRMVPFTAANSINLLLGRTVKFPRVASLFCHAISGGLPRDLIRAARRTVELRRMAEEDLPVTTAILDLVRNDLTEAVDAAAVKAREKGEADKEVHLFKMRTVLADTADLRIDALAHPPALLTSVPPDLTAFVLALITIREYFDTLLRDPQWRQLIKQDETIALIDELAIARAQVATSRLDCVRRLVHIRAAAGLSPIPDAVARHSAPTLSVYNGHTMHSRWRTQATASVLAVRRATLRLTGAARTKLG